MSAGCPSSLLCLPVPIPSSTAITCVCSHWDFSLFRVMLLPYTRLFPRFCLDWSIWLGHWAICVCEMVRKGKKGCMELTSECRLRWWSRALCCQCYSEWSSLCKEGNKRETSQQDPRLPRQKELVSKIKITLPTADPRLLRGNTRG